MLNLAQYDRLSFNPISPSYFSRSLRFAMIPGVMFKWLCVLSEEIRSSWICLPILGIAYSHTPKRRISESGGGACDGMAWPRPRGSLEQLSVLILGNGGGWKGEAKIARDFQIQQKNTSLLVSPRSVVLPGASRGIGKGLVSVLLRDSRNHVARPLPRCGKIPKIYYIFHLICLYYYFIQR